QRERDQREDLERRGGRDRELLLGRLVAADDARELLALLGLEDLDDVADRGRGHRPHLRDREVGGAERSRGLVRAVAEREADAVALGLRVVERRRRQRERLAVARDLQRQRPALVLGDRLADRGRLRVEVLAADRLAVHAGHGVTGLEHLGRGRALLD